MFDLWLFAQLSTEEKRQIEPLTRRRTFQKGEMLFRTGDRAAQVLLLTRGRVKMFKVSEEGKEIILGFLNPHDLLGEETLFRDGARSFSAQALEDCGVCVCSKDDFEGLAARFPTISAKITRTLGEKLSQMADRLADMAMYDVRDRVCRELARLARQGGHPTAEGIHLDRRITHDDLSALVGASRVMVSNVLADLRKAGLVVMDQRHFVVTPELLEETPSQEEPARRPRPNCACFASPGLMRPSHKSAGE